MAEREPGLAPRNRLSASPYDDALFFHYDLGVVVLDDPIRMPVYAELPTPYYLNAFMRMEKPRRRFTAVGYGLEKVRPKFTEGRDTRRLAKVKLNTLNGTGGAPRGSFAIFSNNPGRPHRGGTCFGDSGGPIFDAGTRIIVAVTSFTQSPNCTGIGEGYRVDQPDDLNWLAGSGSRLESTFTRWRWFRPTTAGTAAAVVRAGPEAVVSVHVVRARSASGVPRS